MTEQYDKNYYSGENSGYIFSYRIMKYSLIWREEIRTIRKHISKGTVLDVGCAYGYFLNNLPDTFEKYGVDYSSHAISVANRMGPKIAKFEVCDITDKKPFNGEYTFDLITCFNVLEHFESPEPIIENITSLLNPGGFFYVRLPFKDPLFCRDKFHFYRSIDEWVSILSADLKIVEEKYWFTLWGKFSDIKTSKKFANFAGIVLQRGLLSR